MDRVGRIAATVLPGLALLLAAGLYFRELLPPAPTRYLGGDFAAYFYPVFHYVAQEVGAGRLPHWTPYVGAGYPLLADIEASVFYPPARLLSLLVGPPSYLALELYAIAHYVLAGFGMLALMRGIGLGVLASSASALTFMLSGFLWGHGAHLTILQSAAWLPWLVLAHARAMAPARAVPWTVATGLGLALSILGGHPQIAFYAALALTVLTGTALVRRWPGAAWRVRLTPAIVTLLALLLGLALAAPQLLPTHTLARSSSRWNPSPEFLRDDALPPHQLLTFLVPLAYFGTERFRSVDEFHAFVGVGALLLAGAAIALRRDPWRRDLTRLAALGLVLAMLPALPGFTALLRYVPVAGLFRASARATLLTHFALAGLAGLGLDACWRAFRAGAAPGLSTLVWGWRAGTTLAVIAYALILLGRLPGWVGPLAPQLPEFYAAFLAILLAHLVVLEAWRAGWLAPHPAALTTVALMLINLNHADRAVGWGPSPPETAWKPTPVVRTIQGDTGRHRVWNEGWLHRRGAVFEANAGLLNRIEVVSHYTSLPLARLEQFSRRAEDPWRHAPLVDLLNVRYLVVSESEARHRVRNRYRPPRLLPGEERRYDVRGLVERPIGELTVVTEPDPGRAPTPLSVVMTPGPDIEVCLGCAGAATASGPAVTSGWSDAVTRTALTPSQAAKEIRLSNRLPRAVTVRALKLDEVDIYAPAGTYRQLGPNLWENASALPRAFLVDEVIVQPDTGRIMSTLEGLDLRRTAVVERHPSCREELRVSADRPPDAEIVEYRPTDVRIRTRHDRPAFLVLADAYFGEWRVKVDGRPAWMHHANLLFRGVCVPPGEHEVQFRYRPRAFHRGLVIALLAGAGAGAALVVDRRRRR